MDLNNITKQGINNITIDDSLKAPLLKLNVKLTSDSTIPNTSELMLYIDDSTISNENRKTYLFELTSPLAIVNGQSDELILEPVYNGKKVTMKSYVLRKSNGGVLLATPVKEELPAESIILFEGANYISTNYTDAEIGVIYPKNTDFVKIFLTSVIYASNYENRVLTLDDIYFKDCFTEVEQGINAEFNKATIKCMNSINNKFTLDCDGNLVVNSITTTVPIEVTSSTPSLDFAVIYPVGSVYLSVNNVNPATLFGGTWERITGYYLYAGEGGTTAGSNTSGNPNINITGSTALSVEQMPPHKHQYRARYGVNKNSSSVQNWELNCSDWQLYETESTGEGQGHTHTLNNHTHTVNPQRFEVYCYKRVS